MARGPAGIAKGPDPTLRKGPNPNLVRGPNPKLLIKYKQSLITNDEN